MNPCLSPALVEFLTGHQSIHFAACAADGVATLVRALACRVAPAAPQRLRLLAARGQAAPVLRALAANGRIAAVFNEPVSHRTVQLKGCDAREEAAAAEDHALLAPYSAALVDRLRAFDTPEPFVRTLFACAPEELVVVSFTPGEIFAQSPGPQAGVRLPAGAGVP